jgi:Zn-dependent protease with chaperone function
VGTRFVFACAWPLVMLYNFGAWLTLYNHGIVRLIGWVLLWPALVLVRFLIVPLVRANARHQEYECDAAAKAAGYGDALHQALQVLGDFEGGRSGGEQVLAATHPPTELRLEALEPDEVDVAGIAIAHG